MLLELRLRNFIHFEDKVVLRLSKGPSILLGPNHTGKTSLFEAIRRCMSLSKSNAVSNVHNTAQFSYASCIFENAEEKSTTNSSIIRLVSSKSYPVIIKILKHQSNGTVHFKAADIIIQRERKVVNSPIDLEEFNYDLLDQSDEEIKEILKNFERSDFFQNSVTKLEEEGDYQETECERLLKKYVDEDTVIIFPFRSFSPYQWTKSKRNVLERRGDIDDEISLKEEIVLWYLKERDISLEERFEEEKYFKIITGNSGFEFEIVNGNKVGVKNVNFSVRNPDTENLLKIPEGIYEAKSAAIVLAVKKFRTICLDDAERGMHPQMIERLRDLVLQYINDKVVLLITHHPAFLAPWNISRTYLFHRDINANGYKFSIKPLHDDSVDSSSTREREVQIITSGQFSSLFFAERICLVEGKTENMFMTALKNEFFQNTDLLEAFRFTAKETEEFRHFLCTLHIVPMEGEAGKLMFHRICHTTDIAHYFILDFDALYNNIPKSPVVKFEIGENELKKTMTPFCDEFGIGTVEWDKIKDKDDFVKELENHDIFVWKSMDELDYTAGCIENAVMMMCKKHGDVLSKFLNANNVCLPNSSSSPEKTPKKKDLQKAQSESVLLKLKSGGKKWKLFKSKKITNRNITNVVKKLLELSKDDESSEFHRLVHFFKSKSVKRSLGTASTSQS